MKYFIPLGVGMLTASGVLAPLQYLARYRIPKLPPARDPNYSDNDHCGQLVPSSCPSNTKREKKEERYEVDA